MNRKSKIFVLCSLVLTFVIIFSFGAINFAVDPFFQYHKPYFGFKPVITDERYQNAGIAKTFDFENVILGNSYSENFRPSYFNKLGGTTVKLTASGSYPIDWQYTLKILSDREEQPRYVILNIDHAALKASPFEHRFELPMYLYDNNYLNDVEYLFNFTVLNSYSKDMFKRNRHNDIPDVDTAFVWDNDSIETGKEVVKKVYLNTENDEDAVFTPEKQLEYANANIGFLTPYFDKMKDTTFVLFWTPFSMYYWLNEMDIGNFEAYKDIMKMTVEHLIQYDNVVQYLWVDDFFLSEMANFDNYKDLRHFTTKMTVEIANRIVNNFDCMTKDDYMQKVDKYLDFIENYPYDKLK